jgi:hypothetical protein
MIFKASFGNRVKVITASFFVFFAAMFASGNWPIRSETGKSAPIYTLVIFGAIFAIGFFSIIRHYRITRNELIVQRPLFRFKLKKINIRKVEILKKGDLGYAIRTFGIGGLFGFTGQFYNTRYGNMTWYRTRTDKIVMVTTSSNRKIVLSPDEPEAFVAALQNRD